MTFLWGIASELIAAAISATAMYCYQRANRLKPLRRLWMLSDPGEILFCLPNEIIVGEFDKPVTGIGQVRAISSLTPSLLQAYPRCDSRTIRFGNEVLHDDHLKNIVSFGGPKSNQLTWDILEATNKASLPFFFDVATGGIVWNNTVFHGTDKLDYGLVCRIRNPYNPTHLFYLFAGSHTFGTGSAAEWFIDQVGEHFWSKRTLPEEFAALIRCDILGRGLAGLPDFVIDREGNKCIATL